MRFSWELGSSWWVSREVGRGSCYRADPEGDGGHQGWHVPSVARERLPSQRCGQIVALLPLQLPGQQLGEFPQTSPDVWRAPGEPQVFSTVSVGEEPHLGWILHHLACLLHVNLHSERVSPGVKIRFLAHFDQSTEDLPAMDKEEVGGCALQTGVCWHRKCP